MKIMFDDYFCFFQYVWTATKGRNAGFKKVIIKFSSNYDIITINCNTIIIQIVLKIKSIILFCSANNIFNWH